MNFIFVPQGQEYQAIFKGLKQIKNYSIQVVPIPICSDYLSIYLKQWLNSIKCQNLAEINILVLGLWESLLPHYGVGDVVIYQNCLSLTASLNQQSQVVKECDGVSRLPRHRDLTLFVQNQLKKKASLVRALTNNPSSHYFSIRQTQSK